MKGLFAWAGFKQTAVSYHREERKVGKTKFNYWKLWTLAIDGITSASTAAASRIWSYLGALVALGALAFAVFIIIRTLTSGIDVPGYASLMVAILFLGGLQLLSLGRARRICRPDPDRDQGPPALRRPRNDRR